MNTLKIIVLSIVQGITELLPVSSTGHLILTGKILDFDISGSLFFLSVLHIGTTLAIIVFYRKELFKNFFTKEKWIFFAKILIASIPTIVIGFLFEDYISSVLHGNTVIALSLIIIGILFIVFENCKSKRGPLDPKDIPLWKMFVIGIGQTLALIPGTSRSGITTLTGMILGIEKYSAFKFSFILGVPVLLGSSIYEITKTYLETTEPSLLTASIAVVKMLPVIVLTFAVGYITLLIVEKFKKKRWLTVFGVYRIITGILILILMII